MPSILILDLMLEDRNEVCALHRMLASILALESLRHGNGTSARPKCDEINKNTEHKSWNISFGRAVHDPRLGSRTIAREREWDGARSD
jgi:hypothetical protein